MYCGTYTFGRKCTFFLNKPLENTKYLVQNKNITYEKQDDLHNVKFSFYNITKMLYFSE